MPIKANKNILKEDKKMKFNVGDIVTGTDANGYAFTTCRATMEVIETKASDYEEGGEKILVRILSHEDYPDQVNYEYWVDPDFFKLVERKEVKEKPLVAVFPSYEFPEQTMETVKREMVKLLDTYGHNNSPEGISEITDTYKESKAPLAGILSRHPNWDPEQLAIVFSQNYKRGIDKNAVRDFGIWCGKEYSKMYAQTRELKYLGKTYAEWRRMLYTADSPEEIAEAMEAKHILIEVGYECAGYYVSRQVYEEAIKVRNLFGFITNYHYDETESEVYDVLDNLTDGCINAETAKGINEYFPELKAVKGQKLSRVIGKLGKLTGLDQIKDVDECNGRDYGWNRKFAMLGDAVNPLVIRRHTIISINPLDYLTSSFGHNWASCHTIDPDNLRHMDSSHNYHGMYMSGTLSYMLDGVTVVFYTVDSAYNGKEFWTQDKMQRNLFHFGEEKLVQGRVYPDGRDGGDESYAGQFRAVMQKVLAECLNIDNLWVRMKNSNMRSLTESKGTHYRDYVEYPDPTISRLKGSENMKRIVIGHEPICPNCGKEHHEKGSLTCPRCSRKYICDSCGAVIDPDDDEVVIIDGNRYFCCAECAEREGFVETMDDGWHPRESCIQDYWTDDWYYYYEDSLIRTGDGRTFICEDTAREAGYVYVADIEEWVREDDVHFCPACEEYVSDDNWDEDMEMCCNCAEIAERESE
jgi:hypothetical protein